MKKGFYSGLAFFLLLGMALVLLMPEKADAIPVFARKYRTVCSTCHAGSFPKLNAFGAAYRQNGYRIPVGDEKFVKEEPLPLGAPAWAQVWPDAIWPGEISTIPPVSFRPRFELNIRPHRNTGTGRARWDFFSPQEIEFLMAGTLGRSFSTWIELALWENGPVGDVERAYIQWDAIFGKPWLNLTLGQYEVRAVPFSRFRKYTLTDFITSAFTSVPASTRAAAPGDAQPAFRFQDRQRGLELWGVLDGIGKRGGIEYAIGVVNGDGAPRLAAAPLTMDNNDEKDVYWRLSYKFGGAGVVTGEAGERLVETKNWVDNSIRLGLFGYYGVAPYTCTAALCGAGPTVTIDNANRFNRHGIDLDIWLGNLNLFGAFSIFRDDIRGFAGRTFRRGIDATAWFLEADYIFLPWLAGALRYETTNTPDDPNGFARPNQKRLIPSVSVWLRPNIRIVTEAEANLHDMPDGRSAGFLNRYRSRFDFLF